MSNIKQANIRAQFLSQGVLSASELAMRLQVSQPTISRLLQELGPDVVRLGAGRATRYALRREIEPGQSKWPLYLIDEDGEAVELGRLHALHGGHSGLWWLEGAADWPSLTHAEFTDGLFEDLPWFLQDMRPQGYMGRLIAERLSKKGYFPSNPSNWSNDQTFRYFLHYNSEGPSAFLIGDSSIETFEYAKSEKDAFPAYQEKIISYHDIANYSLKKAAFGSSAGGEQQKFCYLEHESDTGKRVKMYLVKFSPPISTETGNRWKDLLVAEHHAIQACSELTGKKVETDILNNGGFQENSRCFLELARFDRVSDWGRRPVVSLEAVDRAFLGMNGRPWPEAAEALRRQELISHADEEAISLYWLFGELIGNNDMHYGNLSFFLHPEFPMTVCPPYDMLPMLYAPTRNGEVVPRDLRLRRPLPRECDLWQKAAEAAVAYWEKLAGVQELSDEFKAIADENCKKVKALSVLTRGGD